MEVNKFKNVLNYRGKLSGSKKEPAKTETTLRQIQRYPQGPVKLFDFRRRQGPDDIS